MAMRKPGVYVALSAHYADDEKIMEAGEDAELLYVRMLAYCARTPLTEGWISDAVVQSRLGVLPRPAGNGAGIEAGTDAGSRAQRLADVGLIVRERSGYRVRSWLKWNRSVEEMSRESARDRNRKTSANDGTDTGSRAGNGAGNGSGNGDGIPAQVATADQIRSETDQSSKRRKASHPLPPSWKPNTKHIEKALAKGIDVNTLAERMRNWAEAKDARYANWDATFRNWIDREDPRPQQQPTKSPWDRP